MPLGGRITSSSDPGTFFTSIIPGLIVPGVVEAFKKSRGKLLFVMNIMTKFGETHNFTDGISSNAWKRFSAAKWTELSTIRPAG